jgi:hypothetical protein
MDVMLPQGRYDLLPREAQRNSEVEPTRALQQKLHGDQGAKKPQAGPWQVGIEQIFNHDADNSADEHNSYNARPCRLAHGSREVEIPRKMEKVTPGSAPVNSVVTCYRSASSAPAARRPPPCKALTF